MIIWTNFQRPNSYIALVVVPKYHFNIEFCTIFSNTNTIPFLKNNINLFSSYRLNYLNNISINQVSISVFHKFHKNMSRKYFRILLQRPFFHCSFDVITPPPTLYFRQCDLTPTYLVCDYFLFLERIQRDNWERWRL